MYIRRVKRLLSLLLAACLCTMSALAFAAKETPQAYHIVFGTTDANGNYMPEYVVDSNGRRVELPQSDAVHAAGGADVPAKWDSRSLGCVTSVKDQGRANCCWAFASVGALEASYVKQGFGTRTGTDFSEAHLAWFGLRHRVTDTSDPTYGDGIMYSNPFLQGGDWHFMSSALMRGSGLQLEKNAPWFVQQTAVSDLGNVLMQHMKQSENVRYVSYAKLWSAEEIKDKSQDTIKKKIMENGSVMMSYWHDGNINGYGTLDDPYLNHATNGYYRGINSGTNHSVMVVGWDAHGLSKVRGDHHTPTTDFTGSLMRSRLSKKSFPSRQRPPICMSGSINTTAAFRPRFSVSKAAAGWETCLQQSRTSW